jgi:hypothetical protein
MLERITGNGAIAKSRLSRSHVSQPLLQQKSFSIVLDAHILGEQDHVEVSPFEARFPLRLGQGLSTIDALAADKIIWYLVQNAPSGSKGIIN